MSDIRAQAIIRAAIFTPTRAGWGLPILFWGEPGVAKTDRITAQAQSWGLPCEVLSPGEQGEGGFGVVPMPVKSEGSYRVAYPPPAWVDQFKDADNRGLVFVDEITTAPPALQPALLGLVHARRIGGAQLPSGVRVIGACNPPNVAAGGWDLSPPLANRFVHMDWPAGEANDWIDWLLSSGVFSDKVAQQDAAAEEERVLEAWNGASARSRGLIAAFIRARPSLLHKRPEDGAPEATRAWPSRRSWEFATRAYASAMVQDLNDDEMLAFVAGCVGDGAANEFYAFVRANDLPDPHKLLTRAVKWKHDGTRIDRTFAVLTACTTYVTAQTDKTVQKELASELWSIMAHVADDALDVVAPMVKPLSALRLTDSKTAVDLLVRMAPFLEAAKGV